MTDEKRELFRERVQPQLRAYLKAAHIEVSEDGVTTVCPSCGDVAGLMKDDTWLCLQCGRRGDLLDYVLCGHAHMTETEAVRHIQRMLGLPITELDAVNANELMDMEFQPTGWLIEKLLGKGVYIPPEPRRSAKAGSSSGWPTGSARARRSGTSRPSKAASCTSVWRTRPSASSGGSAK